MTEIQHAVEPALDDENLDRVSAGYYTYTMTNAMVTSYQTGGAKCSRPVENVSLNFEEIKVTC